MDEGYEQKSYKNRDIKLHYFSISTSILQIDKIVNFDLYLLPHDKNKEPVLYRAKNLPFTEENVSRLKSQGVETLLVRSEDKIHYGHYLESNLRDILNNNNAFVQKRVEILYDVTTQAVKEMLDNPRTGDLLSRSKTLVENTLNFMFREPSAFQYMLKIASFDYYTHTHSVNVGIFALFIAREVGIPEDKLLRVGMGALLHDLGKCRVDPNILTFPGKLSPEQFEQMKKHPEYGYEILTEEQGMKDEIQLDIVRHHHEKLTGIGYPDKLKGKDISIYARISAIADIFDALTTRRTYKNAFPSFDALKLMKEEMTNELDPQIFKKFVLLMGQSNKPPGLPKTSN